MRRFTGWSITVRRNVSDIRRDGIRAVIRKTRRLPGILRRTRPFESGFLLIDVLRLWVAAGSISNSKRRSLLSEQVRILRSSAGLVKESPSAAVADQIKDLLRMGRLKEVNGIISSCDDQTLRATEMVHQRAQLAYLSGRWEESVSLQREEALEMDRLAAGGLYASLAVRFISGSFIGHIGHLGLIDLIQKARYLGELSPELRIFVGRKESVANQAYLDCWRTHMDVHYLDIDEYRAFEKLMRPLFDDVSIVRLRDSRPHFYNAYASINEYWSQGGRSPLLSLDPVLVEHGQSVFERQGLDRSGWFVGLHVREGDPFPWTNAVDSDVINYLPAIRAIIAAGGTVVRIGSANMRRLPEMKGLIDYASANWKSPELDVYIWSQCRFFIGTGSGPLNIPPTFGRPSILTNFPAIALDQGFSDHLMLPKRVLRGDGSQVTFNEILASPFGYSISRKHQDYDWRFEDNSPSELEEACLEMIELTREEGSFARLKASQGDLLGALHTCGRTGRSPFPSSFINRCQVLLG